MAKNWDYMLNIFGTKLDAIAENFLAGSTVGGTANLNLLTVFLDPVIYQVLCEKGDIYLVDSTVTGSDAGTWRFPKYPFYHYSLILFLQKLKLWLG